MRQFRVLALIFSGMLLISSLPLMSQDQYVLVTAPGKAQDVCGRHGLTQITGVSKHGVFLVSTFSPDPGIATDSDVQSFEVNHALAVPELSGATMASLTQSTTSILDGLGGRTVVNYFGASVASNYVQQPAVSITRSQEAQSSSSLTGAGVTIALIDTGVDTTHPALRNNLLPGFNFITNATSASELGDLPPGMAAALEQSTTSILDGGNVVIMNSSTAAILSQSTTSILDGAPGSFGHGTMTAGMAHLVAPNAKLMPLKAFAGDGSSDIFNIIRAIYYAADNGANVINMSFEISQSSPALQAAIQYALSKNVVVVAASGNDGKQLMVYPAGYNSVIGVGSSSNSDVKSSFTNFGTNSVFIAAPGEGVVTTYPGGNYAAGWGTSFSAPFVAGEAALILQARPGYHPGDVANAISRAVSLPQMGHGRTDLCLVLSNIGIGSQCASSSATSTSAESTSATDDKTP
ncbi:MAG TPA: S8 family serine peptidase [Candidatus Angelobacter sp.]|nr:S8 family serine peptidase [Candidatus Angelobacter sp.]